MSNLILQPTVGDVVWFFPSGTKEGAPPLAAIVRGRSEDGALDLSVVHPELLPLLRRQAVKHISDPTGHLAGGDAGRWDFGSTHRQLTAMAQRLDALEGRLTKNTRTARRSTKRAKAAS